MFFLMGSIVNHRVMSSESLKMERTTLGIPGEWTGVLCLNIYEARSDLMPFPYRSSGPGSSNLINARTYIVTSPFLRAGDLFRGTLTTKCAGRESSARLNCSINVQLSAAKPPHSTNNRARRFSEDLQNLVILLMRGRQQMTRRESQGSCSHNS